MGLLDECVDIGHLMRNHDSILAERINEGWGGWIYDWRIHVLRHTTERYEIDLERCRTSAEILDWISQVQKKGWATPQLVGDMVEALDDLLNFQANYCSWGAEQGPKEGHNIALKRSHRGN